ncbi:MAG: hypothetical protein OHK0046_39640 [Anaerolineae bacterium]
METQTSLRPEKVIAHYIEAYQKLYNRTPRELQILDNDWVIVNGARMRLSELEYLTVQLQHEYKQGLSERRSLVNRLVKWFKG